MPTGIPLLLYGRDLDGERAWLSASPSPFTLTPVTVSIPK